MTPLNLVFMGTPDLAATVLRRVLTWTDGRVVAVYCQPDRPAGRGLTLKEPPVKTLARELNIPVHQPVNFKNEDDVAVLRTYTPDFLLVAAYGLILPQRVLDIPRCCALNVHTSLLPRYRGAAPIQRAIMNGNTETGVTIMRMDAGMDTGPIVLQKTVPIADTDTAATLHDTLAEVGGELLVQALEGTRQGRLVPVSQRREQASYAAKLSKADGAVNFSRPVHTVHAQVRGVTPWPGAHALLDREGEEPLLVHFGAGTPLMRSISRFLPPSGRVLGLFDTALAVQCGEGIYGITELRPAGKKAMDASSFFNGYLAGRIDATFILPLTATTMAEKI